MDNQLKCAGCGAEINAGDRFCPVCGQAVQGENKIACGKCGHLNDAGGRYCEGCGEPLGAFSDALSFEDDFGDISENPYDALEDDAQDAFDALDDIVENEPSGGMTDEELFGAEEPEAPAAEEPKPAEVKKEEIPQEKPKQEPVKKETPKKEEPKKEAPRKAEEKPKPEKKKKGAPVALIIVLALVAAAAAAYFLLPADMIDNLPIGRKSAETGLIVDNTPVPTENSAPASTDAPAEESAEATAAPTEEPTEAPTAEPTEAPAEEEAQMPTGPAVAVANPPKGSFVQAMTKLSLMDGPGEEFNAVGTIAAGGAADYLGEMMIASDGEGWYLVSLNGTEGWISAAFTQLMD